MDNTDNGNAPCPPATEGDIKAHRALRKMEDKGRLVVKDFGPYGWYIDGSARTAKRAARVLGVAVEQVERGTYLTYAPNGLREVASFKAWSVVS